MRFSKYGIAHLFRTTSNFEGRLKNNFWLLNIQEEILFKIEHSSQDGGRGNMLRFEID